MKKNVGSLDRAARSVGFLALGASALFAPVPLGVRIGLGVWGVYLLFTALAGTCLGYRMLGLSTCPVESR